MFYIGFFVGMVVTYGITEFLKKYEIRAKQTDDDEEQLNG